MGQFNDNMAAVADQLAQERQSLADAITLLNKALADVAGFVRDNTTLLTTNVNRLADVTLALVQQRQALAEVLDVAPAALGNLAHAYNPDYGTLDTRDNSLGSTAPEVIVCQILAATGRVTIANLPIPDPTLPIPVPLPTTPEGICARLLSGDANADNLPDDLNGNGVPDLQELLTQLGGGSAGGTGGRQVVGLPSIPGSQG